MDELLKRRDKLPLLSTVTLNYPRIWRLRSVGPYKDEPLDFVIGMRASKPPLQHSAVIQ
jgi:hypothetical protein